MDIAWYFSHYAKVARRCTKVEEAKTQETRRSRATAETGFLKGWRRGRPLTHQELAIRRDVPGRMQKPQAVCFDHGNKFGDQVGLITNGRRLLAAR
jgi:hypothetical protein